MDRISIGPDNYLDYQIGSGGTIEIFDILVTSQRRAGIGRGMVELLLRKAEEMGVKRVWAITRDTNFIAQQFYESMKFRAIPLRDFYGEGGVDAIMYIRDVGSLV